MRLEKVEAILDLAYTARLDKLEPVTIHLLGPPGIGKSAIVKQWAMKKAKQLGKKWVDVDNLDREGLENILRNPSAYFLFADRRLMSLLPEDLSGIPRDVGEFVQFKPLLLAKMLAECSGILFLDEYLYEKRENMKASSFKLIRDFKMGDLAMSQNVIVIAASNDPKHSAGSDPMWIPQRDRFVMIYVDSPSIEAWTTWMDETFGVDGWDRTCLAYLRWKPSDFLTNVEDLGTDDGVAPPASPRGWTIVSTYLLPKRSEHLDQDQMQSFIIGKLGTVGERYWAFRQNKVPSFDELAKDPSVIAHFKIEQKYLAAVTIAEAVNAAKERIKKAVPILEFIAKNDDREIISALFAFLSQQRRTEVFTAVRDISVIYKAMERTGKALL